MKKRGKVLIILAVVLVIVIVAAVILTNHNKKQEAAADNDTVTAFFSESAVAEFSYTLDGEKLSFLNETGGWVFEAKEEMVLDVDVMGAMADMLTTVAAEKLVEEDADLEKYGLDNPSQTVEFTLESGESHVLALGDKNEAVSGVYAMVDGSGDVYLLDDLYVSVFSSEVVTLVKIEAIPVFSEGSYATYLRFENENGIFELNRYAEPPMKFYTTMYNWFTEVDGEYKPVDSGAVETALTYMTSAYAQGAVAVYPDEAELAGFGLDAPVKAAMGFETPAAEGENTKYTEFTLLIGDKFERDGQTYRYVMQEGGTQVIVIYADLLENVMHLSYADMMPKDICPLLRYQMKTIDIAFGGKEYEVTFKKEVVKGEDGEENTVDKYYVDGVEMAPNGFLDWYFILSGMTSEGIAEGELTGESVLTIEFHRDEGDGFDDMTMNFYKYDSEFYRVEFGGEDYMLANRRDVEAFMEGISELQPA